VVINEFYRMWGKTVVVRFEVISHYVSEATEQIHEKPARISGFKAGVWPRGFPTAKQVS
jgi:hypothetical protein